MKYNEYLQGVNKTWKKADGIRELMHCRLAIMEEVGEIAGWYKKYFGYGRPKDEKWKVGIKGEFGDLLYYLTKLSDITRCEAVVESYFEDVLPQMDTIIDIDHVGVISGMSEKATCLVSHSWHSDDFTEALEELFISLRILIEDEGWVLEDIQISNLSKLEIRHGKQFNQNSTTEEGRDRNAENQALS